ncbi:MAG TPA: TIGR04551 family protein, partial [Anaeromyxobacteraceae bacterium]|nr:TIGR04551 family protein [Anaeromyxobacteraceae bacterium]
DARIQEAVQKEVAKVKEQLRDEVRAEIQGAQSAAEFLGDQEDKKKLHFLELNGYFRFRWDLFNNLNGGLPADPMGWYLWNGNTEMSASPPSGTQTGGNMRLRVDPTFNISEQVRVRAEIDFLDNVVLGSNPVGRDWAAYAINSGSQTSPIPGVNWFVGAVQVKRAWGEVQTPVGLLSFGRMPADWGVGIYYNAGNGIDQDFGDNVDRIQFSIPLGQFLGGLAVTPYYEWAGSGITYAGTYATVGIGQPVNWTQDDDAGAIGIMVSRTDTPDQARRKLEKGGTSLNYGLLFNWKSQRFGLPFLALNNNAPIVPSDVGQPVTLVQRDASAGTVDLFLRWIGKRFELEAEAVGVFGSIGNVNWDPTAAAVSANILQGAGVLRGKAKLGDGGRIHVGGEFGMASGDVAPGFGNFPGRCNVTLPTTDPNRCNQVALPGSFDGSQVGPGYPSLNNYRFNPAYQVDLILWRRILGTVTDAWYLKPTFRWDVLDGLTLGAQVVYSQALFAESTPSQVNKPLGIELDIGVKYQSDDGFVFFLDYGLLKLLSGFDMSTTSSGVTSTVSPSGVAQNIHAGLGIVF